MIQPYLELNLAILLTGLQVAAEAAAQPEEEEAAPQIVQYWMAGRPQDCLRSSQL